MPDIERRPTMLPDSKSTFDAAIEQKRRRTSADKLDLILNIFLSNVSYLDDATTDIFDKVFVSLIERTGPERLVRVSEALAIVDRAPLHTIRTLASHDTPSVAAPVLRLSSRIPRASIFEIINTGHRSHLLAIAERMHLDETLTDAIIRKHDFEVSRTLANNENARFSDGGYAAIVKQAESDDALAEKLGVRFDIPGRLLRELIEKVADLVVAKVLTAPRIRFRRKTDADLPKCGSTRSDKQLPLKTAEYLKARDELVVLNRTGKLNNSALNRYAVRGEYTHVIAALALKIDVDTEIIEPFIDVDRVYSLTVACKAARLDWTTTQSIIRNRPGCPLPTPMEQEQCQAVFDTLLLSKAQWTMRFDSDRVLALRSSLTKIEERS